MKRLLLLALMMAATWSLSAQPINIEDLPEAVQEEILAEEMELDNNVQEDEFEMQSEQGYYKGSARTLATDTIIYYRWNRENEEWMQRHRKVKTYNDDELLVSVLFQCWSFMEETWVNGRVIDL